MIVLGVSRFRRRFPSLQHVVHHTCVGGNQFTLGLWVRRNQTIADERIQILVLRPGFHPSWQLSVELFLVRAQRLVPGTKNRMRNIGTILQVSRQTRVQRRHRGLFDLQLPDHTTDFFSTSDRQQIEAVQVLWQLLFQVGDRLLSQVGFVLRQFVLLGGQLSLEIRFHFIGERHFRLNPRQRLGKIATGEHAIQRVVVFRWDRIVLVIVTACTTDRDPHQTTSDHINLVRDLFQAVVSKAWADGQETKSSQRW
ncbi:hypothetical protein-transmembrane prediction [Rhodopirellula baltica SH 1]|uniref:Uncharacterized protein n=1 Tax=Rhodopirellula baltica (strain DSM 10527 / NCIMB 13988 / SH1) TaxID=243090 RepID=Q7UH71_RHOBA|nr:hypothetical protein-transmembrane prediction [Rhodopirellula baltica SH 1]